MRTWNAAFAAFRKPIGTKEKPIELAIIVRFQYGSTDLSKLYALEDKLREGIEEAGLGEFDGHEIVGLQPATARVFFSKLGNSGGSPVGKWQD